MSPGDICMQVWCGRPVRKVKVVDHLGTGAGMVMVEAMYGPLRGDRYPIHVTDLVLVTPMVATS